MTREELLKLGIYAPTRFSEQIELRLKLGQKVLFKYPVTPSKYRTILISIGHSNAPYIAPNWAEVLQFQFNIRDIYMVDNILSMRGWGMVSEYLIRPKDLDKFISYLHD
jgi:hypothetical protein